MSEILQGVLERPLVDPRTPTGAPDRAAEALATRLGAAYRAVREGAPGADATLAAARTEAYRQAATTWDDPWRLARVAEVEEVVAERSRSGGDLPSAWAAWRSGWWIRRLLDGRLERGSRRLADDAHGWRCRADLVMAALHAAVGRDADARERLDELAAHPGDARAGREALPNGPIRRS